ncbi:MAG: peptide deformylase [Candidatus Falkowbacteria bacterium]|nr:peptide deformylase [Candidatus Falkowbacteria bacterium]
MKKTPVAKTLPIVHYPDPILRKISQGLTEKEIVSQKIRDLAFDLEKTMLEKDGAGLAAPQVGENVRMVVLRHDNQSLFLINPKITKKSRGKITEQEGCLSIIDSSGEIIYHPIERHKKVTCLYFDLKGKKKKIQAEDPLLARAIQHEVDHLDGILFIDYLEPNKK